MANHSSSIDTEPKTFSSPTDVCTRFGFSRTTLWRLIRAGSFPRPVQLSPNRTAFSDRELDAHTEKLLVQRDTKKTLDGVAPTTEVGQ